MIDIPGEIEAAHRAIGSKRIAAGQARTLLIRRTYDAAVDDVWDACTDADRIRRWFLPVSGDLRAGGSYQLEGNAHGDILACEPPRLLRVSWIYGEASSEADVSEVEVRLSAAGDAGTLFELEHAAVVDPERWDEYGPGAVGVGWDGALFGLGLHLRGGSIDDPAAWQASEEARELMTASSRAWGRTSEEAGTDPDAAAAAAERTTAFYVPD